MEGKGLVRDGHFDVPPIASRISLGTPGGFSQSRHRCSRPRYRRHVGPTRGGPAGWAGTPRGTNERAPDRGVSRSGDAYRAQRARSRGTLNVDEAPLDFGALRAPTLGVNGFLGRFRIAIGRLDCTHVAFVEGTHRRGHDPFTAPRRPAARARGPRHAGWRGGLVRGGPGAGPGRRAVGGGAAAPGGARHRGRRRAGPHRGRRAPLGLEPDVAFSRLGRGPGLPRRSRSPRRRRDERPAYGASRAASRSASFSPRVPTEMRRQPSRPA
jgi:hypothetical protein